MKKALIVTGCIIIALSIILTIESKNKIKEAEKEIKKANEVIRKNENNDDNKRNYIHVSANTMDALDISGNDDYEITSYAIQKKEIISDEDLRNLAYQVYGEVGICSDDYYTNYLQACVVLNRVNRGWGDSITEVIYQDGQFETWFYEDLRARGAYPSDVTWQAVYDALNENTTPQEMVYADSRDEIPEGCYLYYESECGQRFYCEY